MRILTIVLSTLLSYSGNVLAEKVPDLPSDLLTCMGHMSASLERCGIGGGRKLYVDSKIAVLVSGGEVQILSSKGANLVNANLNCLQDQGLAKVKAVLEKQLPDIANWCSTAAQRTDDKGKESISRLTMLLKSTCKRAGLTLPAQMTTSSGQPSDSEKQVDAGKTQ